MSRDLARSGSTSAIDFLLTHRRHRFHDRFPADRGTSHAPWVSAVSDNGRQTPIDGRQTVLLKEFVGQPEMPAPQKAFVSRQR